MSVLQDSFCEAHGLQCGYCTPGMLIAAQGLLSTNPDPTEAQIRDAIGGNLCRCTGYPQIVEAGAPPPRAGEAKKTAPQTTSSRSLGPNRRAKEHPRSLSGPRRLAA